MNARDSLDGAVCKVPFSLGTPKLHADTAGSRNDLIYGHTQAAGAGHAAWFMAFTHSCPFHSPYPHDQYGRGYWQ